MKRILVGALALSLLGGTAAVAQSYGGYSGGGYRDRDRDGRNDYYEDDRGTRSDRGYYRDRDRDGRNDYYEDDRGTRHDGGRYDRGRDHYDRGHHYGQRRHWQRGGYWRRDYGGYYVNDYGRYRLRTPPRGYRWVRTNDGDYLMVAIATGLIASVILSQQHNGYRY
jgi:Ni/Co efflux regulator RcnB